MSDEEVVLDGGMSGRTVVRVGDTVRRAADEARASFLVEVLRFLEEHRWGGAPRHLGTDEAGRQILTYLPGRSGAMLPDHAKSDVAIVRVTELVREFHDLTAGTPLSGDEEVVGHGDLSPGNTIYRREGDAWLPYALIDWSPRPTARLYDVAQLGWHFTAIAARGDPAQAVGQLRLVCETYGLGDRAELVGAITWRVRSIANFVHDRVRADLPPAQKWRDAGLDTRLAATVEWLEAHAPTLDRALR